MKKQHLIITLVAVVLVAVVSVGTTLAFLTAKSDPIVNTFTVGNVEVEFSEPSFDPDAAKIVPGSSISKDPTVKVCAGSEPAWVAVKVVIDPEIAAIIDPIELNDGWVTDPAYPNIYFYNKPVKAGQSVTAFDEITVDIDAGNDAVKAAAGKTITVTGYAVQAENVPTLDDAKTKFPF